MPREYTYGPFKSRRLGLSLGVDILPKIKTCSFNCVYCEIGNTPIGGYISPEERISYPPKINFEKELYTILKMVPNLDSITFGYNGEPTLNENLLEYYQAAKRVRENIKWTDNVPKLSIFTNSSTLYDKNVRNRIKHFDLIIAKMDTTIQEQFQKINRPHRSVKNIGAIIQSIKKLKLEMKDSSKLILQILLFESYSENLSTNTAQKNIKGLAKAVNVIEPDAVHLYSIARIPAEFMVYSVEEKKLYHISNTLIDLIDNDKIKINYF